MSSHGCPLQDVWPKRFAFLGGINPRRYLVRANLPSGYIDYSGGRTAQAAVEQYKRYTASDAAWTSKFGDEAFTHAIVMLGGNDLPLQHLPTPEIKEIAVQIGDDLQKLHKMLVKRIPSVWIATLVPQESLPVQVRDKISFANEEIFRRIQWTDVLPLHRRICKKASLSWRNTLQCRKNLSFEACASVLAIKW